jgi:hypothetical protein
LGARPPKEHVLMTRSIVSGLVGLLSIVVVGGLPIACQSGGVGDPCTPEDEYDPGFAGFKVTEENIESRSFQCQTRICLVNHFQGRVSCPLGQAAPTYCNGPDDASCPCVEAAVFAPDCEVNEDCPSGACDQTRKVCTCTTVLDCPGAGQTGGWSCAAVDGLNLCRSHVCFDEATGCQTADGEADNLDASGNPKACCVPGTNTPIAAPVCGQCDPGSNRNAENAVYCSCRCGAAEGSNNPEDENFNFCDCPDGFVCSEIRKDVGLGDRQITGKYCIKQGTEFTTEQVCGAVVGYHDSTQCKGIKAPGT